MADPIDMNIPAFILNLTNEQRREVVVALGNPAQLKMTNARVLYELRCDAHDLYVFLLCWGGAVAPLLPSARRRPARLPPCPSAACRC